MTESNHLDIPPQAQVPHVAVLFLTEHPFGVRLNFGLNSCDRPN
ncbi:MAG: hypothetical protein SRB2_02953 [Desulfobacteraceae bacterium Eth-SRB2]|nr:MAG: hypothetical protein SRB2_02953 [Desulfobacteraceae bacterium Eth-SRB2]